MESVETEVRTFYSLQDLRESIDETIKHYASTVEEYTQWLGLFLRDAEDAYKDQEWFKKLAGMQKMLKAGKKIEKKEKASGKKKNELVSPEWVAYKEILLCTNEQAQAEIVFEAIEDINDKIDRLAKIRNTLVELEKSGLGTSITYIAFMRNGVPEKLVLRQKKDKELAERFKFAAEISVPIKM
ncbi:MAG: hypothetical protein QXJ02_03555 [Candidatus Bathyarchaeia archaeon]